MQTTLVFDLDGTLVDSAPDLLATVNDLMIEHGFAPFEPAQSMRFIGHGIGKLVEQAFAARGAPLDKPELDHATARFIDLYAPRMTALSRPYAGVEAMLQSLRPLGYRVALCTNKRADLARTMIADLGWAAHFDWLAGFETYPWQKPDGRAILSAARDAGHDGGRIIMVGDSPPDIAAARDANVPVIGFAGGYAQVPMADLKPDRILDNYSDFYAVLASLNG